jgi:two-component system OmpR family response regulator
MLPELDGFEVVKRIRSAEGHRTPTPIIFLTAKDTTQDKIQGLSIGGDDYVTKPFSIEELIARVKAVLRRAENIPSSTPLLSIGDLEINEETREVRRGARSIELTPTEYRLLHYLVSNQRTVLSKVQLLEHIWEYDFDANASVLETYISYLRKKIDVEEPKLIHTIRGIGYSVRIPQGA